MAVPARRKLPAKVFEVREGVQGAEMIERARTRAVHFCGVDKLVPSLVREQRERAKFAPLFKMTEDFRGDALQLFRVRGFGKLRTILHQSFLSVRRFLMSLANESDQLLPRLAMCSPVLSRVNGSELPLVVARQGLDRLG